MTTQDITNSKPDESGQRPGQVRPGHTEGSAEASPPDATPLQVGAADQPASERRGISPCRKRFMEVK